MLAPRVFCVHFLRRSLAILWRIYRCASRSESSCPQRGIGGASYAPHPVHLLLTAIHCHASGRWLQTRLRGRQHRHRKRLDIKLRKAILSGTRHPTRSRNSSRHFSAGCPRPTRAIALSYGRTPSSPGRIYASKASTTLTDITTRYLAPAPRSPR